MIQAQAPMPMPTGPEFASLFNLLTPEQQNELRGKIFANMMQVVDNASFSSQPVTLDLQSLVDSTTKMVGRNIQDYGEITEQANERIHDAIARVIVNKLDLEVLS